MRRWTRWGAVLLVGLTGCRPAVEAPAEPAPMALDEPGEAPEVTIIHAATELTEALAKFRGEVLVVNVWATWCPPCLAEFPALTRLRDDYRDRGVRVITVSGDYPDDLEMKVIPHLARYRVEAPAFLIDVPDDVKFIGEFDRDWTGAYPATFIYDAAGQRRKLLEGEHSYEEFQAALDEVLAGS